MPNLETNSSIDEEVIVQCQVECNLNWGVQGAYFIEEISELDPKVFGSLICTSNNPNIIERNA